MPSRSVLPPLILALGALLLGALTPQGGASALPQPDAVKVVAPPGLLDPVVSDPKLLHRYGAFDLYVASPAVLHALPDHVRDQVRIAPEMDLLLFDKRPIDTRRAIPALAQPDEADVGDGAALHLVQFVGPIKQVWLDAIEQEGAHLVHYVANNGYLVWADGPARRRLSSLARETDFLQYSAPYHTDMKVTATLEARAFEEDNAAIVPVVIQIYHHAASHVTEALVRSLSVEVVADWTPILRYRNAIVRLRLGDLATIAARPDVYWIGERRPRERLDEVQSQILAGAFDETGTAPSGPGYLDWLEGYGFSRNPADYPIIDITDDGIGDGTLDTGDPTLHDLGDAHNPSRVAFLQSCASRGDGGGIEGHGHINASIAGGYDTRAVEPYRDDNGFQRGLGVNPYARLAGTRIFYGNLFDLASCGGTESGLIQASFNAGARISSNSWGCSTCAGSYDEAAQAYDAGVRDADSTAPGNQQFAVLFAAGNSGTGAGTVGSPGNAKNVITVGASENTRPTWTDGCRYGPAAADSAMDIAAYSSRGPAPGGRAKPDVVAPGTHVQGTASSHPGYSGAGVCDPYWPTGQTLFSASSGTSHATPAVAGVVSLYHHWLAQEHGIRAPSPAMLKAYLLAHPTYLTGTGANDTLPSASQGFGMPDMSAAFDGTPRLLLDQTERFDDTGQVWRWRGRVVEADKPFRLVLAYTDAAGAIGTNPQINNLDLQVKIDDLLYSGNGFAGEWSRPGTDTDTKNNTEAIFLPPGTTGELEITVIASNIAGDGVPGNSDVTDQDFALVCYNCVPQPGFTLAASPDSLALCAASEGEVQIHVGSLGGYTEPVTLSAAGLPLEILAGFATNPVTPPGDTSLWLSTTGLAAPGSYEIDIVGTAAQAHYTTTVQLDLDTAPPEQPVTISPTQGAPNQLTKPRLTWSAPEQAATYTLEIDDDPQFQSVDYTASGLTTPSHTVARDLAQNTLYYWRIRAENSCGPSTVSGTASFATRALPGECSIGSESDLIYQTDFETEDDRWFSTGMANTWIRTASAPNGSSSGSQVWHAWGIDAISDQRLTSPAIDLPEDQSALTLQYWNYQEVENAAVGCFDGALLEITADNGLTWSQIDHPHLLGQSYDGAISTAHKNPLGGRTGWCGDPRDWEKQIVDLDDYAGETVRFRFRLGTDNSGSRDGWTIDDVTVQGCVAGVVTPPPLFLPLLAR